MTLTHPDFRLDQPNPNTGDITDAEWWLWLRLHELEPKSRLGGILASKKGYHGTGQYNLDHYPDNYSIRDAVDRTGPWWKGFASALDWTFPDAQAGDFHTIDKYTSRLVVSALDAADPRLDLVLREFYGNADLDEEVEGYDERKERHVTSDDSHLWHIHMSFTRSKCGDMWGMWALLTVLMGWSVSQWRASLPADAPKPPAPAPKPPSGLPVHKLGSRVLRNTRPDMRGTDIQVLQKFIGSKWCGKADGIFGDNTESGVRRYQRMRGLKVDGVAGPKTLAPIMRALGIR